MIGCSRIFRYIYRQTLIFTQFHPEGCLNFRLTVQNLTFFSLFLFPSEKFSLAYFAYVMEDDNTSSFTCKLSFLEWILVHIGFVYLYFEIFLSSYMLYPGGDVWDLAATRVQLYISTSRIIFLILIISGT